MRGERTDLNGPFLAREALRLGLEPARIAIVGDAPEELEAALRDALAGADAVLVSGGLGPTHDDRTVELVAKALGVGLHVDPELEAQIEAVSRAAAERLRRDYADFAPGVTKQATVPDGAISLGLAGTAPGLLVPRDDGRLVVVLPGPPGELQAAVAERARDRRRSGRSSRARAPPGRRVLRLFGVSESAVARALAEAGGDGDGVEVTICARDFEIHVDLVVQPGAEARADALEARVRCRRSSSGSTAATSAGVEEHVLELCRARGLHARDGGVVHRRPRRGAADVGARARATSCSAASSRTRTSVKEAELGVPAELLEEHGAVSAEVAAAMARGARERLGAGVAVVGDRHRRPGRRHAGEARRARLRARRGPGRRARPRVQLPGRPRVDPRPLGRRSRCTSCARF